jgi:hypothetical protein
MSFKDDFDSFLVKGLTMEKVDRIYNVSGNVPYVMRKHEGHCGSVEEAAFNAVAHVKADMAYYIGHGRVVYTMTSSIEWCQLLGFGYRYKLCYYMPVAPPTLVDVAMREYSPQRLERFVIKELSSLVPAVLAVCVDDVLTTLNVALPMNVLSSVKAARVFDETEPNMAFAAKTMANYIHLEAKTREAKCVTIHHVCINSTGIMAHVTFDHGCK